MNSPPKMKYSYKRKSTTLLLWGLFVVCLLLVVVCGYKIGTSAMEYSEGNQVYEKIAENKTADNQVDFQSLTALNKDVVGWISRPGIGLDYPIVQATDNDYYLTHLVDGSTNKLGSIFMDYKNDPNFGDKNTIIYGHNMKDGAMFAVLMNYTEQSFYNDYPWIQISTPQKEYKMNIFAGFVVHANEFDARINFSSNVEFMDYVNKAIEKSSIESRVVVRPTSKIVTLYTCSYQYQNARYVLMGVLN